MANYIAVIHKDEGSHYGVSFPDFPGCITGGESIDIAKDMAREALELHIEGMLEDGTDIPKPSTLEAVAKDNADAVAFFVVGVKVESEKPVRFNASLPENLLRQIDDYAGKHGMTRSGFLAQAARHELGA